MAFLEVYNSGIASVVQTVWDGVASSPLVWSGAGLKIKAILNIVSLALGAWPLWHFGSTLWDKLVTGPGQGKEASFSGGEMKNLGLQITATILLWTPLLGSVLGGLIVWIIN